MANISSPVSVECTAFLKMTGAGVVTTARGCSAVRTLAGIYTITLDPGNGVNASQFAPVGIAEVAGSIVTVASTSDTVKVVTTANAAGVATDLDFSILINRVA